MKADVVIPLSDQSKWQNNELRYCLRSLDKYFTDLGEIYVLSPADLPWLQNAHLIYKNDPLKSNKDGNLVNKVLHACRLPELSEQFIRLSDDQLFLQPTGIEFFAPFYLFNLKEKHQRWWSGKWKARMRRTMDYLTERQLPAFHFDTHSPQLYDKSKFLNAWNDVDFEANIGYCINTFYFNHYPDYISRMVRLGAIKITLEQSLPRAKIMEKIKNRQFMGYSDAGLNDDLKQILAELFPEKSRYEQ